MDSEECTQSPRAAVIPGRADRREPGIHNHRLWLWIPRPPLSPGIRNDSGFKLRRAAARAEAAAINFIRTDVRIPDLYKIRVTSQITKRPGATPPNVRPC